MTFNNPKKLNRRRRNKMRAQERSRKTGEKYQEAHRMLLDRAAAQAESMKQQQQRAPAELNPSSSKDLEDAETWSPVV